MALWCHPPGSKVLSLWVLARSLRDSIWPTDYVGRRTEDRFLVILSDCSEDALRAVSERMLKMSTSATIEWWLFASISRRQLKMPSY